MTHENERQMMEECNQFMAGSRKWHICNGTANGLTLAKQNQYRVLWGLSQLVGEETPAKTSLIINNIQDNWVSRKTDRKKDFTNDTTMKKSKGCGSCGKPTIRNAKMDGKGPGSQLISIFKEAGFQSCASCYILAEKMDRWGTAGCRAKLAEIVKDIMPRALAWEAEKVGWFAKLVPEIVTETAITILVNRAIVQTEAVPTTANWAYGVTTITERADTLLPKTLASLAAAGFDKPRLFVDDVGDFDKFGLDFTTREPRIRTFGNWLLGLSELLIRNPDADKFAMFQDDFITCRNLRGYLDQSAWPAVGYLNLYTFPVNQQLVPSDYVGWFEAKVLDRGQPAVQQQTGYGAVGLAFSREAVITLLEQQTMITKPLRTHNSWKRLDGVIALAMNIAGWREFVHSPSLIQHAGLVSSMGQLRHPLASSFPGEDFDALTLLEKT